MKVRTRVKSGGSNMNHNQTRRLRIRTGVKAGGIHLQHNQVRA